MAAQGAAGVSSKSDETSIRLSVEHGVRKAAECADEASMFAEVAALSRPAGGGAAGVAAVGGIGSGGLEDCPAVGADWSVSHGGPSFGLSDR